MYIKKLSDEIHKRVLGYPSVPRSPLDESRIENNLKPFGLHTAPDNNDIVNLPIPEDFGTWQDMTREAVAEHTQDAIDKITAASKWQLPELPSNFSYIPGWQGWNPKAQRWQKIEKFPDNKVFFLDIETVEVEPDIWLPTCAVAMSDRGWLLWVTDFNQMPSVIPYGYKNVLINFNTPYDRSYLDTEYRLADTGNRFFDLMSAWIVCRGLSNQQRPLYLSDDLDLDWMDETATNGLSAVYEFYYKRPLDKGVRDEIVNQGLPWVRQNMSEVIKYCCEDVYHTAQVHRKLYPEYLLHRPSAIAQSGAILLGSCWLPLDAERFPRYYGNAESQYQAIVAKTNRELYQIATEFLNEVLEAHPYPEYLFSTPKKQGVTKDEFNSVWNILYCDWCRTLPEPYQSLDWLPAKSGVNKGLPDWYRNVIKCYKDEELTLGKRFVPVVLGLTWKSEPLLWGLCGAVNDKGIESPGWYTETYGALPHPEKRGRTVTSVFAKGFVKAFEDGILATSKESVKGLLADKMSTINWVSLRKRVKAIKTESPEGFPVVLPRINPNGTVTGRCADNLWQVAANPKKSRIGTELKSMISPPPGYAIVGADVDSQEAWLAGIMGDSVLGMSASTPLGFICVAGTKAKTLEDSTDIHSVMAKETGISRDNTKTRVYGAIYGQGRTGDMNGLLKNIPGMTLEEAKENSELFIRKFKGDRKKYRNVLGEEVFEYKGGLASFSFNVMESIADSKTPKTPLLQNVLSEALRGIKDFKPSRVNWTIQSSGVDFRDMLVLLLKHFYTRLGVQGKLLMTIHDEIRTLVRVEDVDKAIYALQLAHLYVRAAFIDALGLDCIPAGVAWFSAVDVDHYCLRKDPEDLQVTPSQPQGLPKGYTVTPKQLLEQLTTTECLQVV